MDMLHFYGTRLAAKNYGAKIISARAKNCSTNWGLRRAEGRKEGKTWASTKTVGVSGGCKCYSYHAGYPIKGIPQA